jgi:DNA-binding beta-propeller fold protein YncE
MSHYKKGTVFALLLLCVTLPGQAQEVPRFRVKEERARDYYKRGLAFYNTLRYVAAREFFYKALDIYPYFHLARRYLGDSYYYSGEWDGAIEQWDFLNNLSGAAYPLVASRSDTLRFQLNRYRDAGEHVFFKSYTPLTWRGSTFARPSDLFINGKGELSILSFDSANILNLNSDGTLGSEFTGFIAKRLEGPLAMARDKDRMYICDYKGDRIYVYGDGLTPELEFGGRGREGGKFYGPSGIAVTDRHIFVSDSGNRRIQKFDLQGRYLISFGADDRGVLPQYPAGVAADVSGALYVADRDGGRVLSYDGDGNFIEEIRSEWISAPRGIEIGKDRLIIADEKSGIVFYNFRDRTTEKLTGLKDDRGQPLQFSRPFAVREDKSGVLYIANYISNRIDLVAPRGLFTSNLDVRIQRVDTAPFPNIALFLTVKNRLGLPVEGLRNPDFAVYENDKRVGVIRSDNIVPYNNRTSIVFVRESGRRTSDYGYEWISSIIGPIIRDIRTVDRIRVIRADEQVREVYNGLHRLEILKGIHEGDGTDSPNTGKGLYEAITDLLPEMGSRAVVLLVSGSRYPHAFNQYSLQRIINYARANEVAVHVISFEDETDPEYRLTEIEKYRTLSGETGGLYLSVRDETELAKLYERIRGNKDKRYLITYRTISDKNLRGRFIDVRVRINHPGSTGLADGGYFVPER